MTRPSLAPKFRFIAHRAFICTGGKARVGAQGEGDFTLAVFRRPGFVAAGFLRFTTGRNFLIAQLELNAAIRNVDFDKIAVFDDRNVAAACRFRETWPMERPEVPPEKRPSVISAQALPSPMDFRKVVG